MAKGKPTVATWAGDVVESLQAGPAVLPPDLRHEADILFGSDKLPELPAGFTWCINTRIGGKGRRVPYLIERDTRKDTMTSEEQKTFIVRMSCEYATTVEAASEAEAIQKAEAMSMDDWGEAWSGIEAEEEA